MPTSDPSPPSSVSQDSNEKENEKGENQWGNKVQFILNAIGLSVGLGNVWRFPGLAYENGGSAFLIPYITSGFLFGLPAMYMEFIMGQYTQANPATSLYMYAPAFHGVGLAATLTCLTIAVFYAVVIGWSMLYLGLTIGGQSYKWTECNNWWNTENCIASKANIKCYEANATLPYSFNNTCVSEPPNDTMSGAEEFFINYVTHRSEGITDFGEFNYPVAGCLLILYVLCAVTNLKGVKILGMMSYVTVPLPYIVVLILFIRGMFLDGAIDGVKFYLLKPDMTKLLSFKTWVAALNQTCFSLSLGHGAIISLASHNKKKNNCFRDAAIVIFFDTLMSVIGGLAVFSILGYLAKQTGKEITKIVASGPSLVFIVYPEAIATMPAPWLWNVLLFAMLFFLGFSTQVVFVELFAGYFHASFPSIKKKWISPIAFSILLFLSALIIATQAGWYWFNLMSDFAAQASVFVVITLQLLLFYFYGWCNLAKDLEAIFGPKPKNCLRYLFSRQSPYFFFCWAVVCPVLALVGTGVILQRMVPNKMGDYVFPIWAEVIGWAIDVGPICAFPICLVIQLVRLKIKGLGLIHLIRPSEEHPSYERIRGVKASEPSEVSEEESAIETESA